MCKKCKDKGWIYVFYHYTIPGTCNMIVQRACNKCEKGIKLEKEYQATLN